MAWRGLKKLVLCVPSRACKELAVRDAYGGLSCKGPTRRPRRPCARGWRTSSFRASIVRFPSCLLGTVHTHRRTWDAGTDCFAVSSLPASMMKSSRLYLPAPTPTPPPTPHPLFSTMFFPYLVFSHPADARSRKSGLLCLDNINIPGARGAFQEGWAPGGVALYTSWQEGQSLLHSPRNDDQAAAMRMEGT